MGLSPELWGYAENIWRRFPAEFISLGSPDLEDFFELVEGGTWCTRVVDTKSEKVIEIVLPRREVPLGSPLTPIVQERRASLEEAEACEDAELFNEVERVIGLSPAQIPKQVAKEVRSQLQRLSIQHMGQTSELQRLTPQQAPPAAELHIVSRTEASEQLPRLQAQRGRELSEDTLPLSPGDSLAASFACTSPRSSVTFNLTPTRTRAIRKEANNVPHDMVEQALSISGLDRNLQPPNLEHVGSTEGSPSASPTSSTSTRRASMQQGALHFDLDCSISHLAVRRNFQIHPVQTSGLRKRYGRADVRRAPEYDRLANGALKEANLLKYMESSNGERALPTEEAWRNHCQDREDGIARETRRGDGDVTSPSCSPPDARLMRRRSNSTSGHTSSIALEPRSRNSFTLCSNEADDPDSPGGVLQKMAARRRYDQMASHSRGSDVPGDQVSEALEGGCMPQALMSDCSELSGQGMEVQGTSSIGAHDNLNKSSVSALVHNSANTEPNSPAKKRHGALRSS